MFGTYERLGVSVYASNREVLRALRRKLTRKALTRRWREPRHKLYRTILQHHADARALCTTFRM